MLVNKEMSVPLRNSLKFSSTFVFNSTQDISILIRLFAYLGVIDRAKFDFTYEVLVVVCVVEVGVILTVCTTLPVGGIKPSLASNV
jgi:hypothetical protein